jgi:hypothetical protein
MAAASRAVRKAQLDLASAQVKVGWAIHDSGRKSADYLIAVNDQKIAEDNLRRALKLQGVATAELKVDEESLLQTRKRLMGIADDLTTAELDLRDARRSLRDAQKNLQDLEDQGITSGRKYAESRDSVTRAEVGLREAQRRVSDATKELTENMEGAANKGRVTEEAFLKLADAFGIGRKRVKDFLDQSDEGEMAFNRLVGRLNLSTRETVTLDRAFSVLQDGMHGVKNTADKQIGALPGVVRGTVGPTREAATSIGYGLTSGIRTGIDQGRSEVITAATNVALAGIGAAKAALGIRSPSKVFRGIGVNVSESMALGIEDGMTSVTESMQRVAAAAAASMGDQPGGDFAGHARDAAGVGSSPAASTQGVTNVKNITNNLTVTGARWQPLDEGEFVAMLRRMTLIAGPSY